MKDAQKGDLTTGPITGNILFFALPLMCGNLLQQMYNIADTWVVGRFLGADALAAVGSSYTLMVFLTSVILGLCMGSGAAVSMDYGSGRADEMRRSIFLSFVLIAALSLLLNVLVYVFIDPILALLRVPTDVVPLMKTYLLIIFAGIAATFLYNYCASVLRAIGNAVGAAFVSRSLSGPERRAGPLLRHRAQARCRRRGFCDRPRAVRLRDRHPALHPAAFP